MRLSLPRPCCHRKEQSPKIGTPFISARWLHGDGSTRSATLQRISRTPSGRARLAPSGNRRAGQETRTGFAVAMRPGHGALGVQSHRRTRGDNSVDLVGSESVTPAAGIVVPTSFTHTGPAKDRRTGRATGTTRQDHRRKLARRRGRPRSGSFAVRTHPWSGVKRQWAATSEHPTGGALIVDDTRGWGNVSSVRRGCDSPCSASEVSSRSPKEPLGQRFWHPTSFGRMHTARALPFRQWMCEAPVRIHRIFFVLRGLSSVMFGSTAAV